MPVSGGMRIETVAENVAVGSGGTSNAFRTEEHSIADAPRGAKTCSYKTFLCSKPPEFSGSDDPVVCLNWIQEIEQAFESSECGEEQKGNMSVRDYSRNFVEKLDLVGHVAPTENDEVKAFRKGLPADMMAMVRNAKAATFREAIE
ncbi:hypothetical protein L6452_09485 [Arctium lappa]|uniref:Uncharacterized protein n=1 Tax=Arctium lappa TaxID=4217 RepID=A0ACB9DL68_ARCLA|nr:hypothetical protein L6452_09485 [Arctium lappa]